MKQPKYTDKQKLVLEILDEVLNAVPLSVRDKIIKEGKVEKIKEKYGIKPRYLTLREYLTQLNGSSYHTLHFTLCGKEITTSSIICFLSDDLCHLYPETSKYYVVGEVSKSNGGDCENYHCDHYLTLESKED